MIVNVKEEWIKLIVNITFFLFLCALTIYGLVHITTNPIIQWIIGIVAFVLDGYMLFILSKAKFLLKSELIKDKFIASGYIFIYTVYTLLYVFLFAVGFYLAELNSNEELAKINQAIETIHINQILINQGEANALVKGLNTEVETTYGKKSKSLNEQISKLGKDNTKLLEGLKKISDKNKNVSKILS
jgi:hypothetical protein